MLHCSVSARRVLRTTTLSLGVVATIAAMLLAAEPPSTRPADGLRTSNPAVYALVDAKIIVSPGRVIEKGTVVVRDGVIEAVGADVKPPADARVANLSGKTIYAGLIDAFAEVDVPAPTGGARHWNGNIAAQVDVAAAYQGDAKLNATLRGQGITARLVAPAAGILKGTSVVVTTADAEAGATIVRSGVASHGTLTVPRLARRRTAQEYPGSPMARRSFGRHCSMLSGNRKRTRPRPAMPACRGPSVTTHSLRSGR